MQYHLPFDPQNNILQNDGFCAKTRFDPFQDIIYIQLPQHLKLNQNH